MYPLILNLKNKPVLVIGGGQVASRKIKSLLLEEAKVTVVSPELNPEISQEKVVWLKKKYEAQDLPGFSLIFACTNQNVVNQQIQKDAAPWQFVNVTSNKEQSDFYNMAVLKKKGLTVGISTEGASPKRAKQTKAALDHWLTHQPLDKG